MAGYAIFLSGPVGAGKTTLGRALAERLSGGFIDGDDLSDPDRPWYGSILRTSRAIVQSGFNVLGEKPCVVVVYPLACANWVYFRRTFGDAGVATVFVSLRAPFASIVSAERGRLFSLEEQDRIRVMIAEGYGAPPFSDLVIDTDRAGFEATAARLERETRRLMAS